MRLIDANALTAEMQKLLTNNDTLIDEWLSDRIVEEIEDAPTIEAEPIKHGRWLKTGQSFVFPEKFRNYFCSECGFELDKSIRTEYHYCPNCGALMIWTRWTNENGR